MANGYRQGRKSCPPLVVIEPRLRPGAWSEGGFLGPDESLQAVVAEDAQTLAGLDLTHETIARSLQHILSTVMECADSNLRQGKLRSDDFPPSIMDRRSLMPKIASPLPPDKLPDADTGYLVEDIQVFCVHWRGLQGCPWDCEEAGSRDFLLINRASGNLWPARNCSRILFKSITSLKASRVLTA